MCRNPSVRRAMRTSAGKARASLMGLFLCVCCPAWADDADDQTNPSSIAGWNLQFSFYTRHFDPDPEHNNNQHMISLEARFENDWLAGLSVFDNSFGQPTQLLYAGKTWPLFESPHWYFKFVGGLIHGYKEPYEDKIPFNNLGIAPAILPSLGYRRGHLMVEAHLAGLAAITFTAGIRF